MATTTALANLQLKKPCTHNETQIYFEKSTVCNVAGNNWYRRCLSRRFTADMGNGWQGKGGEKLACRQRYRWRQRCRRRASRRSGGMERWRLFRRRRGRRRQQLRGREGERRRWTRSERGSTAAEMLIGGEALDFFLHFNYYYYYYLIYIFLLIINQQFTPNPNQNCSPLFSIKNSTLLTLIISYFLVNSN